MPVIPAVAKSIRTKTALLFFIVFISIILPVNSIVYSKVRAVLFEAEEKGVLHEAERLMSLVRFDPMTIPIPAQGYTISLHIERDLHVAEIFSSPDFPSFDEQQFLLDRLETDTLQILNLRKQSDQSRATIIFSLGKSNIRFKEQLTELKFYLFAANAVAVCIAGILIFFVSDWMLRPLKRIVKAASQIQTSKNILPVPMPKEQDELWLLTESINLMLQRIDKSVKEQTNFFASAAHELRTPLTLIKAELTRSAMDNATTQIESLLDEVDRLERTINDFLLISELKADTLAIRKKNTRLDEIVYSSLKKVKYLQQEYGSTIQLVLDENAESYLVELDIDKIENVCMNLIENAIKYSPKKTSIKIAIHKTPNLYTLTVSNLVNETVVDPESFKREFKKSPVQSTGLGMGLWICNEIIARHGALLQLKSTEKEFIAEVRIPA